MATYGLNTLRDTMSNAWQYGDIRFSKEANDINLEHNTIYPLCLVIEPNSSMPSIYEGWEDYSYEVYFSMLWKEEQRSVGTIEQKWDNIQTTGNEWLDTVLSTYDNEDLILDDETLEIERIKNFGNDKVLAIKFTFTLQAFRTCFNPKEFYVDRYVNYIILSDRAIKWQFAVPTSLTYDVDYISATAWVRADGWKTVEANEGEEYIVKFIDMSAQNYVAPGVAPPHTEKHDFDSPKLLPKWTTDFSKCDMLKTDQYTNNLHFADGSVVKSGRAAPTDLTPEYNNWDGAESGGSALTNSEAIFNRYSWTIFFVFELPKLNNQFHLQRIFSTSQNPGLSVPEKEIDIYITNTTGIANATLNIDLTGAVSYTVNLGDLVNDASFNLRADTTFAIGISFDSDDSNIRVSTQKMTPIASGGVGLNPPFLWGLAECNLLYQYRASGNHNHYTGKFYEALFYNGNLFEWTDVTIDDLVANPTQNQAIEILNKLSEKYNIIA